MDAKQFLAEFGHIANAPGGVARLRELVLQLAISGQLVKQLPGDSDVKRSLVELRNRRHKLLDEKKLSATRKHKNLEEPKGWLPVPNSWNWEALGYLSLWPLKDGDWIESKDQDLKGDVRIVQLADVGVGTYRDRSNRFLTSAKAADLGCYFLERNDVLIARLSDPLGRACIFPGDKRPSVTVVDVAVCRCDPEIISPRFLMNCLNSPAVSNLIKSWAVGTTRQRVATGRLGSIALPIAPIEEQSRIVAKVDELMALCDQLEAQQQDRRKLQNALRQSTLQALASAQSPHELQDCWQRLQANFGRFLSEPEDVKELRLVVMELAIRGLLTEQLISDGDAAELDFAAPAAAASSSRGRKKSAFLQEEVSENDSPFALPKNWKWARLADVGYFLGGGTPSKSNPEYWRGPIPWVSPKDMKVARINASQDQISERALSESAAKLIPAGSLLVVVRGMILAHSFPVGLTSREVAINQDMKALCPYRSDMSEFLLLLLTGSKRRFLELVERSTHGTCRLETDRFASCLVGIPPLPEQLRIVETVNQLMLVCDTLQSQLNEMQKCSATLAIASVANLTGIAIKQEEEAPVKAPQTELIAPLRLGTPPDVKDQAPLATLLARHNGEMSARDLWRRFGGEIDAFYAQLKSEVAHGWIAEPDVAEVREKSSAAVGG